MKTSALKKTLGAIILAIFAVATFMLFKRLPPIPKLFFLGIDVLAYYLVMKYLITTKN